MKMHTDQDQDIKETSKGSEKDGKPELNKEFVEPDSEDKDNENQKQMSMTLSNTSHFGSKSKKKHKNHTSKCDKVKRFLMHAVHHFYTQILILILACYSLFHQDIQFLCLPKEVDSPFHHITEATFFFFLIEFFIFVFCKNKFIGSFYFYLDMISLISLIPEVYLIWVPLMTLIAGSNNAVNQILSNSHLAKTSRASQAGSKASKYLRLLRLMNFIKVIRVAKLVDTSSRFKMSSSNSNQNRNSTTALQDLGRRKILINQQREILDKMVALTLKSAPLPINNIPNTNTNIYQIKKISTQIKEEESCSSKSKSNEGDDKSGSSGGSRMKNKFLFQTVNSKRNSNNSRLLSNNSRLNSKSNLISQRNSVINTTSKRNSQFLKTFKNSNFKNENNTENLKTEENVLLPETVTARRRSSTESIISIEENQITSQHIKDSTELKRNSITNVNKNPVVLEVGKPKKFMERRNTLQGNLSKFFNQNSQNKSRKRGTSYLQKKESVAIPVETVQQNNIGARQPRLSAIKPIENTNISKSRSDNSISEKSEKSQNSHISEKSEKPQIIPIITERPKFKEKKMPPALSKGRKAGPPLKSQMSILPGHFKNINLKNIEVANAPLAEDVKKISLYFSNPRPFVENILNEQNQDDKSNMLSAISSHNDSNDQMDSFEEKKMQTRVKLAMMNQEPPLGMNNSQEEFEKKLKEDEQIRQLEELERSLQKKKEAELLNEVINHSNSKLEKRLTKGITHQVVIIIMLILVTIPMIDIDFISDIVYSAEQKPKRHDYCLSLLSRIMNESIYDDSFFPALNTTFQSCFYSKDYIDSDNSTPQSEVQRILMMEFNQSQVYKDFMKYSNKSHLLEFNGTGLHSDDYFYFIDKYRISQDYQEEEFISEDNYNNITYYYDVRLYNEISSITGMLKSTFVAILLIIGSYIFSIDVNNYVIMPLDKIFAKLNFILQNVEAHDKEQHDDVSPTDELEEEIKVLGIGPIFDNEKFDKKSRTIRDEQANIKKDPKKKKEKNTLETHFIDKSLFKMLKLISMSIGKIGFLVIPNSDLEKDLSLNLNSPSISYEGISLTLKITNTEELFTKHPKAAGMMLSKIFTIFHSLGIIYLGEPFKKENLDVIVWRKDKKDWMKKTKKYAIDLVMKPKSAKEAKEDLDKNVKNQEADELIDQIYFSHYADLSVICALKFIHHILHNMKSTILKLKECNVQISLLTNFGEIMQSFIGSDSLIYENLAGSSITDAIRINDNLLIIDETVQIGNIPPGLPSFFIDENVMPFLHIDIKKFIFPHDVFLNEHAKDKKRRTIYRHYYNYAYSSGEFQEEKLKDNFIYENFDAKDIFEQRIIFERLIVKERDAFLNYLVSNETYLGIVSELGPTIRTLVNLAFSSFEAKDLNKCDLLIKDLKHILNVTPITSDPILAQKIEAFGNFVGETYVKDKDEWVLSVILGLYYPLINYNIYKL